MDAERGMKGVLIYEAGDSRYVTGDVLNLDYNCSTVCALRFHDIRQELLTFNPPFLASLSCTVRLPQFLFQCGHFGTTAS